MKDLPEINFSEMKKRKGFIPWLMARFGLGGRGFMGGANSGAPIMGRAVLGGSKFGAASGMGGLLAGKTGFIAAALAVTVSVGAFVYLKAPAPQGEAAPGMIAEGPDYVPAVLRQQQNQTSSLEMFSETNRGIIRMDPAAAEAELQEAEPAMESEAAYDEPAPVSQPAQEQMAQQMVSKLTGSIGSGLSNTMGSGSSKFSGAGGFGNKFKPATIDKSASMGEVGAGFSMSPAFSKRNKNLREKKMLAMRKARRPVYGSGGSGRGATGKGAFSQAKGVKRSQQSYIGNNAEGARSTQEKAWSGTSITDGGVASGGAGLGNSGGGSGIVTSPSLDNIGNVGGASGADEPVDSVSPPSNVSPWQGLPQMAMMLTMLSSVLSLLGGQLIMMGNELQATPDPTGAAQAQGAALRAGGMSMSGMAIGMASMAMGIGGLMATMHDQGMMGGMYSAGGGVALAAGVVSMTGDSQQSAGVNTSWMSGIAGGLTMITTMATTMVGSASTMVSNVINK